MEKKQTSHQSSNAQLQIQEQSTDLPTKKVNCILKISLFITICLLIIAIGLAIYFGVNSKKDNLENTMTAQFVKMQNTCNQTRCWLEQEYWQNNTAAGTDFGIDLLASATPQQLQAMFPDYNITVCLNEVLMSEKLKCFQTEISKPNGAQGRSLQWWSFWWDVVNIVYSFGCNYNWWSCFC